VCECKLIKSVDPLSLALISGLSAKFKVKVRVKVRKAQTERPGLVNFAHCIVAFSTLIRVVLALRCHGIVLVLLRGPVLSLSGGNPCLKLLHTDRFFNI
jgi:hypothetical protein